MEKFTKIDLNNYYRAEHYIYFMENVPCAYDITANIDITNLKEVLDSQQLKLYPALIFMLSNAVNQIVEMRFGINLNNELGFYDICHPSYTISNAIVSSFSGVWDYAKDNFRDFYQEYLTFELLNNYRFLS